ncbi:putative Fe-Mo cluster-binding protein, NifX family [Thermodesulfobium acidiphilum]|uniref:Putative Fe-Mo cluster-binding protein, NifX family n=1 Tax=Thermodesulfobium acidiphilum TaxID=1794699 RepID=A0A2R4W2G1_THEAF|nr:NifB/NifX family molybdenum-iron cluster-binding protein [Thermodesulfobium acidiphilum]AWB10955.1 putative Fe-Mo cluster-binding protein, NifX family [Thermodesulfobium acidiphilum]
MKVAFTSQGNSLDSQFDERFGRAMYFIIYDTDTNETKVLENMAGVESAHGAGISAAKKLVDAKVDALVTGNCGPNAFYVLSENNIKIYLSNAKTVKEAIEEFKNKKLEIASSPTKGGHWR